MRGVVRPFARHFGKRNQWDGGGAVERWRGIAKGGSVGFNGVTRQEAGERTLGIVGTER